ncbi:MAG: hypothetical protein U1E14_14415 [Geminicoccaceae bacterium]
MRPLRSASLEPVAEALLEAAWAWREEAVGRPGPALRNRLLRAWQVRLELALGLIDADGVSGGDLDGEQLLRTAARRHRLGSRNTLRGDRAMLAAADRQALKLVERQLQQQRGAAPVVTRWLQDARAVLREERIDLAGAAAASPPHPPLGFVGP